MYFRGFRWLENMIAATNAEGLTLTKTNGECEDYTLQEYDWTQLPTEVWMKIIYQLPRRSLLQLSCTCWRLHRFCYDPILWTNVSIDWQTIKKNHKKAITERLFSRSRVYIKKLNLTILILDSLIHYENQTSWEWILHWNRKVCYKEIFMILKKSN